MDVQLPDGTLLQGIPDGTTKAQIFEKMKANGHALPDEWMAPPQPMATKPALGRTYAESGIEYKPPTWDEVKQAMLNNVHDVARGVGRTGRNIAQGAMALPAMIGDAPAAVFNAGAGLVGSDKRIPQYFSNSLQALDDPKLADQNATERLQSDVERGVAGTAMSMGAGGALASSASPVASGVGQQLVSQPASQLASAVTSSAASGLTREAGGGQVAQIAAGLGGAIAPGAITTAPQSLVKNAIRGGEDGRQAMQRNIDTFEQAGTTPSVGQATQGRVAQATESLLAKTPGSAGVMAERAGNQASEIGEGLDKIASKLSPKSSGEQSGRAILKGISGEGGFVDKFKAVQKDLYDKLDDHIPANANVDVSNTRSALDKLNADIPGAPALSKFFKNAKIGSISGALEDDLSATVPQTQFDKLKQSISRQLDLSGSQANTLPYEAIKKLRTLVGNEMSDSWAGSDVPRSKWKALYGALSSDLESAANKAGPEATQAWTRANTFTRAGMARIESLSSVIEKNGGPEKVFQAATSGTKEGATTLRAVMQSLPEDGQKVLSATVIRRLGSAKAGTQNELGDKFSTETFLTNWNTMSPEAKRVLFDRYGAAFRDNMDQVAKTAANLRSGSKVFVNPSGTGQATAQTAAVTSFVISALTGHPGTAAAIAGGAGTANLSARLMTNPNFVRWLAGTTKTPTSMAPAMINQLAQLGREKGDIDLVDAAAVLNER